MSSIPIQQQQQQYQQQQQQIHNQQQQQQQQSSVPISSSTSYYTNSPSPPHVIGVDQLTNNLHQTQELSNRLERTLMQDIDRQLLTGPVINNNLDNFLEATRTTTTTTTNLAQFITHSNLDRHSSDNLLVISRNQFDFITNKIDQLSNRLQNLEQSLTTDVRLILNLLQAQIGHKDGTSGAKAEVNVSLSNYFHSKQKKTFFPVSDLILSSFKLNSQVPEYENVTIDSCRTRYVFQRSVSEPKPISSKTQQHSQPLHR